MTDSNQEPSLAGIPSKKTVFQGVGITDSNELIKNRKMKIQQTNTTNPEFFNCDLSDVLPYFKDDMASMEHPMFSLSTKPDMRILHYEHNGNTITIFPSTWGLPTIHDKDMLIYAVSHLQAAINEGKVPSRTVRFTAHDFLVSTQRGIDGRAYQRFKDALNRLRGTTINTNIKTGKFSIEEGFGLINSWRAVKEDSTGRVIAAEIELSKWLYNAILSNELLTINPDYFYLRKPIERRIYELARKHCGNQQLFKIGLDKLHNKIGTKAPLRKLRAQVREIVTANSLPDYEVSISEDIVTFTSRTWRIHASVTGQTELTFLKPETFEKARAAAPGWDVHALEQQWREWMSKKKEPPRRPDSAFIAFCRKKGPCP